MSKQKNYTNPAFQNAPTSPPPFPHPGSPSFGDYDDTNYFRSSDVGAVAPQSQDVGHTQMQSSDVGRAYANYNAAQAGSPSPTPPTSGTFPPGSPPTPRSPPIGGGRTSRFKADFGHLGDMLTNRKRGSVGSAHGLGITSEEYGTQRSNASSAEVLRRYPTDSDGDIGTSYAGGGGMAEPDNMPLNPAAGQGGSSKGGYGRIPSYGNSPYAGYPPPTPGGGPGKQKSRYDWIAITVIILAIYSTLGSLAFIILAVARPRYKIGIGGGTLSPQTASLLSAFFAKTIELSFVTVFVAFLGQVLSRRAFLAESRGFNLAELSMRVWIMQPGSLFTNFHSVRFAGTTFLGALSLTAASMALLYTTASDTLVSPKLQWSGLETRTLSGLVQAQFADVAWLSNGCRTIIPGEEDPPRDNSLVALSQTSCFNLQTAGQGYGDLSTFLNTWNLTANMTTTEAKSRPPGIAFLNTTVYTGYWVHVTGENGINNVTMAMPHAGLVGAAKNTSANNILQPENQGIGQYDVTGSVPNPAVNVLCSAINARQLRWFIGQENQYNLTRNGTLDPVLRERYQFDSNATRGSLELFNTDTKVFEAPRFRPGMSGNGPIPFNTQIWSNNLYWDPSIYLLLRTNRTTPAYSMCSIRGFLTVDCSSRYQAMLPTGQTTVNCDPKNRLAYKRAKNFDPRPQDIFFNKTNSPSLNYKLVLGTVSSALGLNTGVTNGNASISRILSQLALDENDSRLNPKRPSLAEAIAVMFGSTLVQSSKDSAFTTYYDYNNTFPPNAIEKFEVEIQSMVFSSGASTGWQPAFYIVLFSIFLANVFCLVYFGFTRGFVTDWTETENLFTLSLNSPAPNSKERIRQISKQMARAGQPDPNSLRDPWFVKEDNGKLIIADVEEDIHLEERRGEELR